jgi:hypothetical protein
MDRPFYRSRPLPRGELHGAHRVASSLIGSSAAVLRQYAELEHEGLVFWLGVRVGVATYYLSVAAPVTDHGPGHVLFDAHAFGDAAQRAREHGLCLLAQVHTHPGDEARHSDGDDDLIPLPFDGMLSLVVPRYGRELSSLDDLVVHQFQDGRWVHIPESGLELLPILEDLRGRETD